jgi:hypothetical protein
MKSPLLRVSDAASIGTSITPPMRSGALGEKPSQSQPRLMIFP